MPRANRTCDAPGCSVAVPRGRLMCGDHWSQLPRQLRTEISASWAAGRIRDWSANCLAARGFLAGKTPKPAPRPRAIAPEVAYANAARLLGERP